MTSTDGDLSPHCLGFTDNLDLQLRLVCDMSLIPTARVTSMRPSLCSWALWSSGTICHCWKLLCRWDQTSLSPAQHLAVLVAASGHEAQILPLLSHSPGLLYQPGCFLSGKVLNTRSSCRNHEKFKSLLASKFPDTASLQHPSSGTIIVWQNSHGSTGKHVPTTCDGTTPGQRSCIS